MRITAQALYRSRNATREASNSGSNQALAYFCSAFGLQLTPEAARSTIKFSYLLTDPPLPKECLEKIVAFLNHWHSRLITNSNLFYSNTVIDLTNEFDNLILYDEIHGRMPNLFANNPADRVKYLNYLRESAVTLLLPNEKEHNVAFANIAQLLEFLETQIPSATYSHKYIATQMCKIHVENLPKNLSTNPLQPGIVYIDTQTNFWYVMLEPSTSNTFDCGTLLNLGFNGNHTNIQQITVYLNNPVNREKTQEITKNYTYLTIFKIKYFNPGATLLDISQINELYEKMHNIQEPRALLSKTDEVRLDYPWQTIVDKVTGKLRAVTDKELIKANFIQAHAQKLHYKLLRKPEDGFGFRELHYHPDKPDHKVFKVSRNNKVFLDPDPSRENTTNTSISGAFRKLLGSSDSFVALEELDLDPTATPQKGEFSSHEVEHIFLTLGITSYAVAHRTGKHRFLATNRGSQSLQVYITSFLYYKINLIYSIAKLTPHNFANYDFIITTSIPCTLHYLNDKTVQSIVVNEIFPNIDPNETMAGKYTLKLLNQSTSEFLQSHGITPPLSGYRYPLLPSAFIVILQDTKVLHKNNCFHLDHKPLNIVVATQDEIDKRKNTGPSKTVAVAAHSSAQFAAHFHRPFTAETVTSMSGAASAARSSEELSITPFMFQLSVIDTVDTFASPDKMPNAAGTQTHITYPLHLLIFPHIYNETAQRSPETTANLSTYLQVMDEYALALAIMEAARVYIASDYIYSNRKKGVALTPAIKYFITTNIDKKFQKSFQFLITNPLEYANELIIRQGPKTDPRVLLSTYLATQHSALQLPPAGTRVKKEDWRNLLDDYEHFDEAAFERLPRFTTIDAILNSLDDPNRIYLADMLRCCT